MKNIMELMIILSFFIYGSAVAADNIHFSGVLVSQPCTLPEEDTNIPLEFDTVVTKYLYQYQRTKSKPFAIRLLDCNPALMGAVNVTFEGSPDSELTDLLAIDTGSSAQGIAIGIELADGTLLPINTTSPAQPLVSGSNSLSFNAFVQIQPTVLANKSLKNGDFTAITTFVVGYQ